VSSTRFASRRDLWGGAVIAASGGFAILEAMTYQVGELARMGPGYFPLMIGCFLIALGILIPLTPDPDDMEADAAAQEQPQPSRKDRVRGMACIAAGIALFIVLGRFLGFLPATFALVFTAAMGDTSHTIRTAALLAAGMTLFGAVVFVWGLQLQFPMFRWG